MSLSHILDPGSAQAISSLMSENSNNSLQSKEIPNQFIGKTFSDLFNYFYIEKKEICIGTFYQEENMSISEFLSSDASALDKFIEKKP